MQPTTLLSATLLAAAASVAMAKKEPIPYCKPCGKDLLGMCGADVAGKEEASLMIPINAGWDASYTNAKVNVTLNVWDITPVMLLHSDTDGKVIVSIDFVNPADDTKTKTIRHQVQGHQECTIPTYPEGFNGKAIKNVDFFPK